MNRFLFLTFFLVSIPCEAWEGRIGQWIWSRSDLALYRANLSRDPRLEAGLFVATVAMEKGRPVARLALSPALAGKNPAAAVIRFDDSFHEVWKSGDGAVSEAAGRLLAGLLARVEATGASPSEIQLDYDCPERLLERWARLVRSLSSGALKGRPVWITSLIAHVRREDYGDLFREAASGHILQVFDTGDRFDPAGVATLRERLDEQKIPFRLGLGAFERTGAGRTETTDHGRWREAVPVLEKSPWYRGLWIFPAGQPWNLADKKGLP